MAKKSEITERHIFSGIFSNRSLAHSLIFRNLYYFLEHYQELYSWLQKNWNCQNKIGTFLQFFHCVKPSYEG
jgi:hypothetical protein